MERGLSFPLFMNTFFSLERFTRLSVPLRLFRVLFWTLFVGVLGAGAAGQVQAQTSTQSTEYPPESTGNSR